MSSYLMGMAAWGRDKIKNYNQEMYRLLLWRSQRVLDLRMNLHKGCLDWEPSDLSR